MVSEMSHFNVACKIQGYMVSMLKKILKKPLEQSHPLVAPMVRR